MERTEILQNIQFVLRDFFKNESLEISASTTADDVFEWDSLNHMNLMAAIEERFDIQLPFRVVAQFESIGDLADYLFNELNS
jgi:acyl carrier protein